MTAPESFSDALTHAASRLCPQDGRSTDFGLHFYHMAIGLAIAISFLHLISLPVAVSYDGFVYIDMADVLGSARFPQDWNIARTPLFPLYLKLSFWLFGRQPL